MKLRLRLKEWRERAESHWSTLSAREKKAVSIGGIFLGIFLIYIVLWLPLSHRVDFLRGSIEKSQKLLVWMQDADKQMRGALTNQQQAPLLSSTALLGWLQKSIQTSELSPFLYELKSGPNDTIEIQFQEVNFDRLISWLMKAQSQQHFTILRTTFVKGRGVGLVGAQITVRGGR